MNDLNKLLQNWQPEVPEPASFRRNVWRSGEPPEQAPAALARLTFAQRAHLAGQDLTSGTARFLSAAEASR